MSTFKQRKTARGSFTQNTINAAVKDVMVHNFSIRKACKKHWTSPPYVDMFNKLEMAIHWMLRRSLSQRIRHVTFYALACMNCLFQQTIGFWSYSIQFFLHCFLES